MFYLLVLCSGLLLVWTTLKDVQWLSDLVTITVDTLLIPVIISVFIYYLLRPVYLFFCKKLKNDTLSLIVSMLIFLAILLFLIKEFVPLLLVQVDALLNNLPDLLNELDNLIIRSQLLDNRDINHYLSLINRSFEDLVDILFVGIRSSTTFVLDFIAGSFLIVSIVPILVIYMLKRTHTQKQVLKGIPNHYQGLANDYFRETEKALSDYIGGKSVVCFYVFLGAWLTFSIAGLKGSLLFAVIAGIMDIIPYFGPWIGALPAILSALISNEAATMVIIIGILIVQLGESYVVSPYVMSKELKLPASLVIIIMLVTGQAFGIIGMIIVLPIIAVFKVTLEYLVKLVALKKSLSPPDRSTHI
ncbi:AI-2E family transporter [Vagococcus sp. BWB3-3]|uniref:AI-2E family transporter n=1 Tax=Vagococcus allomyrinae TaxID=2794353 RepID=A0A940PAG3_9ENTE|nr:AI-2E family transporter [Vagococcus allomyrinae]